MASDAAPLPAHTANFLDGTQRRQRHLAAKRRNQSLRRLQHRLQGAVPSHLPPVHGMSCGEALGVHVNADVGPLIQHDVIRGTLRLRELGLHTPHKIQ